MAGIRLAFGAFSPTFDVQLAAHGFCLTADELDTVAGNAHAILRLNVHGLLPEGETAKARQRLTKAICAAMRPVSP